MTATMITLRLFRDVTAMMVPRFEVNTPLARLSIFKSMMMEEMVPKVPRIKTTIMVYLMDNITYSEPGCDFSRSCSNSRRCKSWMFERHNETCSNSHFILVAKTTLVGNRDAHDVHLFAVAPSV